jgi:hypothetical protein
MTWAIVWLYTNTNAMGNTRVTYTFWGVKMSFWAEFCSHVGSASEDNFVVSFKRNQKSMAIFMWTYYFSERAQTTHHAEGLVNPKVLAKKTVTDFRYPRGPEHFPAIFTFCSKWNTSQTVLELKKVKKKINFSHILWSKNHILKKVASTFGLTSPSAWCDRKTSKTFSKVNFCMFRRTKFPVHMRSLNDTDTDSQLNFLKACWKLAGRQPSSTTQRLPAGF